MNENIDENKLEERWLKLIEEGINIPGVIPDRDPLSEPPEWYDPKRMARGQAVHRKYGFSQLFAVLSSGLILIHLPQILIQMLAMSSSVTVSAVFLRVLATLKHSYNIQQGDPFEANSLSHKSFMKLRKVHLTVTKYINKNYTLDKKLWLNQLDMVITVLSSAGLMGISPKKFVLPSIKQDQLEDLFYSFRVYSYCLGIEDRFNPFSENYQETMIIFDLLLQRCIRQHLNGNKLTLSYSQALFYGMFYD